MKRLVIIEEWNVTKIVSEVRCDRCRHWDVSNNSDNDDHGLCVRTDRQRIGVPVLTRPQYGCALFEAKDSAREAREE